MEGQSLGRRPPPVVLGDAQRIKLVIIYTHQWNLCTTTLVKFITTCLTTETLEKQLSAKVTKC